LCFLNSSESLGILRVILKEVIKWVRKKML
jgi:hypothetical protein